LDNTRDLSKFGHREREMAGELLTVLQTGKDRTKVFGSEGIAVEFNPNSANVFLVDGDYNTAMIAHDGTLRDFVSCPECGHEGFLMDGELEDATEKCCLQYASELNK